ncbi:SWIM zinc finger family protein [Thermus sp.]|uniref:SWIM zinc finger family protein n=1 Tax=Thermus sp. TaxID=275 RepID=UPI00307F0F2A
MKPFPPEKEEDFAPFFPAEVLRRGLAYAREGRVLRVYRLGERLFGEVRGSAEAPYRVEVGPGLGGSCTCPYPDFPCKHAAALLYAYLDRGGKDLKEALEALPPEEAKALLLALAALPRVGGLLLEALFPERALEEEAKELKAAFRLGLWPEEALEALLVKLPRVGEASPLLAVLEALLEAPQDPGPYLGPVLARYRALGGPLRPLLALLLRHPFPELVRTFLEMARARPEEALPLLAGKDPWREALRRELLFALGQAEEALSLMRARLEAPEDYLALVDRLLALGREEEALRYAEEALEWFGKDPRLFPLADLLASRRGLPQDLLRRFALRPSLSDYAALRVLLGPRFREERPALLKAVKDPALLAWIHLLEEDWKALDRLLKRAPLEAYPALAEALEERLPGEALRLYLDAARALVEEGGRARYREVARLLKRARALDGKRVEAFLKNLRALYPRRRALWEELASLSSS